jgi:hypothetical protein
MISFLPATPGPNSEFTQGHKSELPATPGHKSKESNNQTLDGDAVIAGRHDDQLLSCRMRLGFGV